MTSNFLIFQRSLRKRSPLAQVRRYPPNRTGTAQHYGLEPVSAGAGRRTAGSLSSLPHEKTAKYSCDFFVLPDGKIHQTGRIPRL